MSGYDRASAPLLTAVLVSLHCYCTALNAALVKREAQSHVLGVVTGRCTSKGPADGCMRCVNDNLLKAISHTQTHTHTHTYIYVLHTLRPTSAGCLICVCVYMCVYVCIQIFGPSRYPAFVPDESLLGDIAPPPPPPRNPAQPQQPQQPAQQQPQPAGRPAVGRARPISSAAATAAAARPLSGFGAAAGAAGARGSSGAGAAVGNAQAVIRDAKHWRELGEMLAAGSQLGAATLVALSKRLEQLAVTKPPIVRIISITSYPYNTHVMPCNAMHAKHIQHVPCRPMHDVCHHALSCVRTRTQAACMFV